MGKGPVSAYPEKNRRRALMPLFSQPCIYIEIKKGVIYEVGETTRARNRFHWPLLSLTQCRRRSQKIAGGGCSFFPLDPALESNVISVFDDHLR
jgi:hypothetical protein